MQMLQIMPVTRYVVTHGQGMTIGPNILILPPLNFVHVCEEAATLDVLTGGNYILGLGLGYRQPEFVRRQRTASGRRGSTKASH
jgi:alkanesulfonate monooxygenase SsuD/methylene tetrahydromethanopterin reductase-like flavin-dependent oxidoreductase (luciferase family)